MIVSKSGSSDNTTTPRAGSLTPNFRLAELRAAYQSNQARIRALQSDIAHLRSGEDIRLEEMRLTLSNLRKRLQVGKAAAAKAHEKLSDSHQKRVKKIEAELVDKLQRQVERSWKNHATYMGRMRDGVREDVESMGSAQRRLMIQASSKGAQWLLMGVRTLLTPIIRVLHCLGCGKSAALSSYVDMDEYGSLLDA